ncbi:StfH/YfcO family fimbrial adhesin [Citrobacter sp. FP75]|uniref:StfH/YfcO family fimbrial adhesin n=1 Tax=Citrobacter sp. FP75 TaxID=1852949 RepID=UPI001BCA332A|nr:StfH/YfcO family fimbrial adhesin [Citrobacter sp. FP75]
MNNKILLAILLLFLGFSSSGMAQVQNKQKVGNTFQAVGIYYGAGKMGATTVDINIMVATPRGVYYGVYSMPQKKNQNATLKSWSGPGTAPVLTLKSFTNVDYSLCPGIDRSMYSCRKNVFDITVSQDNDGCPWLTSTYAYSYPTTPSPYIDNYRGPTVRDSRCTVPVDTYDVSWSPDAVQHDKLLKITPSGGTMETTLHTYLMESGMLCDGSKFDERGAGCRFVATGTTLTVLGCDNNIVTTTAVVHPIIDVELHDIKVSVNTKNIGSGMIKATCNFQYIIEQL